MENETWENEKVQIIDYLLSSVECKELLLIKIVKWWVLRCFLKICKEDDGGHLGVFADFRKLPKFIKIN